MKKLCFIIIAVLMLTVISGCASSKTIANEQEASNEHFISMSLHSKAIAKNIVNETAEQEIAVYLPPSYYDSEKNYPVVYYLHGFSESPTAFVFSARARLDEAFSDGAREFILVSVNGKNRLGGSFYENSPVTGNWEEYVTDEVVSFIDKNFRTIENKNSRGICGFSMGGYGAYNIALKHPDIFNSFLTMSPGALADEDLPAALESWAYGFRVAYAQTFSPDVTNTRIYGSIPELSGTPEDNIIVKNWENGYGNISQKIDDYIALQNPLKAMKIIYGENDSYPWIPKGCEFFSARLSEKGITHSIESFPYGHILHPQVVKNYIVPFFNENLEY